MRRTAASTGAPNSASGSSSSSGSSAARAPMSFAPAAPSRPAAAIDPFAPRSRVAPSSLASSSAARSAASSAAGVPARPARAPSASAAAASPAADDSDLDLEGLLGWDARRAADRARDERALRDRILARDREMRADRQRVQRLAGASSELSDMLAAMLARSSIGGGGFGDEAGPALDPLTGLPQSMCVTLRCFSFAVADRPQLQGDKIILPGEALYQINRLRLPFPLLFRIEKMGADGEERKRSNASAASAGAAASSSSQYAGVLEFSAPAEQCFLPQWMMENLRVGEGDSVRVYSESHVPQARWVKLQPHSQSFSALLRELGPKYFLENAMRHYSVLTKGQRIMVTHAGQNHSLDVVDARPNDTVSLLGNLDLEVEFGPALDAPREERDGGANTFRAHASGPAAGGASEAGPNLDDEDEQQLKRALAMSLAESGMPPESPAAAAEPVQADASPVADDEGWAVAAPVVASAQPSGVSSLQARFGSGNRLGGPTVSGVPEAKYAEPAVAQPVAAPAPAPLVSAQPDSKEDREGESDDDDDDDGSDAKHDASPLAAVEVPPNHSLCPTCNRAIATSSFSLHTLHCARAFSKCAVCARMVKKTEAASHAAGHARMECPQCHVQLESRKLRRHVKRDCAYRPAACKWCAESTPLVKLPSHEAACGSLTQDCPVCEQPVPRRDMQDHPASEACRVQCAKCEEVIIARDIVAHTKDRCSGRMVECPYCHLSFAARETGKHEEYCGSRTESCEKCQRYIKLRDMARHADSACSFPPVEAKPAPPAASAAARASPPLGAQSASAAARISLLSSMLEGGANVDPGVMAALLAQSVELEDPLSAAAARNAGASLSPASTSVAARQAAAARAKQRRGLVDSDDDSDVEEYMQRAVPRALRGPAASSSASSASGSASASAATNQPKPAASVRSASSQRAPSPSAAVSRAPAAGPFRCAYCRDTCASLDNLQVHILTECSEAHARMEGADPAAAAKALAGMSVQEHVSVRVPVAKPVPRAQGPSSSGAGVSASPAFSSPPSSSSTFAAAAAFDPYDLSWKRPHRQASEELRRHAGARHLSQRNSDSDSDDDVQELSAAEVRAAKAASAAASASSVPARPKLMTGNSKLRQHVPLHSATGASSSSLRPSSFYANDDEDDDDAPQSRVSSCLYAGAGAGSGSMKSSTRAPFSATPSSSSLKQQQRDLEKAISARKAATAAATSAAVASRPAPRSFAASHLDDDEPVHAPAPRSSVGAHQPSPAPRRSSGSAATGFNARTSGVSPSFMGGLGADVPIRSSSSSSSGSSGSTKKSSSGSLSSSKAPSAVDDYEKWLSSSMAHSSVASRSNPAASLARSTARPVVKAASPFSSARGAGTGAGADPSPLASYLARGSSSSNSSGGYGADAGAGSSPLRPSSYEPLSFGASPSVTSASAAAASLYAHGASPSLSSRDRPSFDRPLSGPRASLASGPAASHSSALYSSSGYSPARPSSPPSNQKAVRSSSGVRATGASLGAYGASAAGAPSSSAYELPSHSVPSSQTASRARAPSATRTPVAVSPHVPLYSNGAATPAAAAAAHARRSGSIGRAAGSSSRPARG